MVEYAKQRDGVMGKSVSPSPRVPENTDGLPSLITGKSDWRRYRPYKLSNGLTCLLVNDKESKTTAMAVCVNVGASADPRDLSGLAHFTEHMCFLGSEKFPGENEYKRFLSCHGGRSNASTSMTCTTYKFDVIAEHAEKAVDIFSNFFISPLFTESGSSREVNAVDSENSKNLTTDGRRRLQVLKALADPLHHWSKFSTGNKDTLFSASKSLDLESDGTDDEGGDDVKKMRDALLAFHRRHYRPSNMTAVIVGPQSLDTLQDWVVPRFGSIIDRWPCLNSDSEETLSPTEKRIDEAANDAPAYGYKEEAPEYNPAFSPSIQGGKWPVLLTTLPLRSLRKLVLMFPLPSVMRMPDQSPVGILTHLLGHEGPGSSFAALQDAGLLNSLVAGSRISAPDQCLLQIDLNLTEEGEEKWKEVVHIIFEHCRLIADTAISAKDGKDRGINNPALDEIHQCWNEMVKLNYMHFHETSPSQAYGFAPSIAKSIATHGTEKCLSAGYLLNEDEETLPLNELAEFSSQLVPSNCIIERCSQSAWDEQKSTKEPENGLKSDREKFGLQKENWYGVEFYLSEIDHTDISKWEGNMAESDKVHTMRKLLQLPQPNRFIPRNLELCPDLPKEATSGPRIEKKIDPPNLIVDDEKFGRLWHKLDDRYALPKASLTLLIRNASVQNVYDPDVGLWVYDIDTVMQSQMLAGVFSDALAQETYGASLAGMHWGLSTSSAGITISCEGYSNRLGELALFLFEQFFRPSGSRPERKVVTGGFLNESHFSAVKDRTIRSLKSYLKSQRADSHAMYYRNLLVSSKGGGIEESLVSAEKTSLESLAAQHEIILENAMGFECLYSGNVSMDEAKSFFKKACKLHSETLSSWNASKDSQADAVRTPGPLERCLQPGEDIEIHFASQNPEEQNGAVLVTYQSQVPGFKGEALSNMESLKYSAAIRVLCHMLREPLFDELRTKQQLGYVVSSYYDTGFSSRGPDYGDQAVDRSMEMLLPCTTPVDYIVVNILSRKVTPQEVLLRLDEFMSTFRKTLEIMPESEIKDHEDALSKKLLKPIQKLSNETAIQFRKICLYGAEVLHSDSTYKDLPWNSAEVLARTIQKLERADLLSVWDSVVENKERSRVVSSVYGNTFPLDKARNGNVAAPKLSSLKGSQLTMVHSLEKLFEKRSTLLPFDPEKQHVDRDIMGGLWRKYAKKRSMGIAAVALFGIGSAIGLTMLSRGEKEKSSKK